MDTITSSIIKGLRRGNEECFSLIFRSYFSRFYYFAFKYLKSNSASEIAVQDLFMLLWDKKSSLLCTTESELMAWMYTSLRHLCYRELQRINREKRFHCDLMENECHLNMLALEDSADQRVSFSQLSTIIKNAIEQLPEQCQRVFKMSREEHLKNSEIAERLNISVKAVEANITRAIKELQVILKEQSPWMLMIIYAFLNI